MLGGPTLYHTTTLKSSFSLAARAKVLKGVPSRAVLSRTGSWSCELRQGATIEGATLAHFCQEELGAGSRYAYGSWKLRIIPRPRKMSIGATKIFYFLYIYLCKLYHTFALLSIEYKIKKKKEDTKWYPLSFRKFALH